MPTPGRRRARVCASSATSWLWLRGDAPAAGGWFFRGGGAALGSGFRMRHRTLHFGRRLVLAQALIDDLAQQIVIGPGQELYLGHELGPHPMHAAEHERRAEAAGARR